MSFHTPAHKHVGDAGKPGQIKSHLSSSDQIPSPCGTVAERMPSMDSNTEEVQRPQRTDGDRMLETFAGAAACKLWWWPTDNGQ